MFSTGSPEIHSEKRQCCIYSRTRTYTYLHIHVYTCALIDRYYLFAETGQLLPVYVPPK